MSLQRIKSLVRKGKVFYPKESEWKQWVRKQSYLIESGRHVALNGKYPERIVH